MALASTTTEHLGARAPLQLLESVSHPIHRSCRRTIAPPAAPAASATAARILAGIFSRAAGQIAIGLVVGLAGAILLNSVLEIINEEQAAIFISAPAALMAVAGLLAALGPARRGLAIPTMEALRME